MPEFFADTTMTRFLDLLCRMRMKMRPELEERHQIPNKEACLKWLQSELLFETLAETPEHRAIGRSIDAMSIEDKNRLFRLTTEMM